MSTPPEDILQFPCEFPLRIIGRNEDDFENFAIEFSGDEGLGTAVMEASKILFTEVNKIDNDNVLVLEIT